MLECAPVERVTLPGIPDTPIGASASPVASSGGGGTPSPPSPASDAEVQGASTAPPATLAAAMGVGAGAAGGGQACAFPFYYGGRNRTDCVWASGVEACKASDGGEGAAAAGVWFATLSCDLG